MYIWRGRVFTSLLGTKASLLEAFNVRCPIDSNKVYHGLPVIDIRNRVQRAVVCPLTDMSKGA